MKIKNYRWLVVALIFFATTINYLDRQIIGLLKPFLEVEFNWTETEFSYIVMAFTAAYAVGLLTMGWFIDKVGSKIGYGIAITVWSVAGMLHAVVRSAFGFGIMRAGLGFGEAGNFPAGMKVISEWLPKKDRGLATGIFNAGTGVGVVLAIILVPWILTKYGWHEVFWITGGVGFIWLFFWLWLYDIPSKHKKITSEEYKLIVDGQSRTSNSETNTVQVKIPWIKLLTFPQTWAVIVGKLLIDPIYWFFLFWLPSYFSSTFSLDLTKPSLELMIIYTSTILGSIGGGWISSFFIKKGWSVIKARTISLLIFAVFQLTIITIQFAGNIWVVVALISCAVAVHQAWAANVFTLVSDMFPKNVVSSVAGIAGMGGAVGGILFPLLVGHLLDVYKASGNITAGYNLLFTICAFTYLVAWGIIMLLLKRSKNIDN